MESFKKWSRANQVNGGKYLLERRVLLFFLRKFAAKLDYIVVFQER